MFLKIIKSISSHKDGHLVTFLKPGLILFRENKKSGRKFYIAPYSSGGIYDYVLRSREEPLRRGREEGGTSHVVLARGQVCLKNGGKGRKE